MLEFNENMFGKPDERTRRVEKYDFPVLTMEKFHGKGTSRRFVFNKAAAALLNLGEESTVGFVFQEGNTYLANTTGVATKESYGVTKGTPKSFSNGKIFDYVAKKFDVAERVLLEDIEYTLTQLNDTEYNGHPVLQVSLLQEDAVVVEEEDDTMVEEIVLEATQRVEEEQEEMGADPIDDDVMEADEVEVETEVEIVGEPTEVKMPSPFDE